MIELLDPTPEEIESYPPGTVIRDLCTGHEIVSRGSRPNRCTVCGEAHFASSKLVTPDRTRWCSWECAGDIQLCPECGEYRHYDEWLTEETCCDACVKG